MFTFQVKTGLAELFGTELFKGKLYEFHTGAKVAVYTWQGCTIELRGKTEVSYIAKETPMVSIWKKMCLITLFLRPLRKTRFRPTQQYRF